jgi:hypothetical protein
MTDPRHALLTLLFEWTAAPYARWFKSGEPWGLSAVQLTCWPEGTLGCALGHYLLAQGFELLPRLEHHDVVHLLTGVGTTVPEEVELQWLLAGNGKRSAYLLGVLLLGTLLLPEHLGRFGAAWARGRRLPRLHGRDYRSMLGCRLGRGEVESRAGRPEVKAA